MTPEEIKDARALARCGEALSSHLEHTLKVDLLDRETVQSITSAFTAALDRIDALEGERDTAWNDSIEAAAKYHDDIFIHDSHGIEYSSLVGVPLSNLTDLEASCRKAELDAAAIRALKKGGTP